jgi:hypothetical protein
VTKIELWDPDTHEFGSDSIPPRPVFVRRSVNDGRPPHPMSGLPEETDEEFRARIKETLKCER